MKSSLGKIGVVKLATALAAAWIVAGGTWPSGTEASVIVNDPSLPPVAGEYRTAADVHATYDLGSGVTATLDTIRHFGFTNITHSGLGNDEFEDFDSILRGNVTVVIPNVTTLTGPVELTGPVRVKVFNKIGNQTGTFDTEMISMSLSGSSLNNLFSVRESPTLSSTGKTTITDIGGGLFRIDSFFDIFTELSTNNNPFVPQIDGPTHVELVPEPGTLGLLGVGIASLVVARWRRRK